MATYMEKHNELFCIFCFLLISFVPQENAAKGCTEISVGLTSKEQFPDHYFTASSSYDKKHLPQLTRLDSETSWTPSKQNNPKDYIQIDLGIEYRICAIGTKGSQRNAEWVSKYKLGFSEDNKGWKTYKEKAREKIFSANFDQNTLKKNILFPQLTARFIRLHPTTYNNWKSVRIELFGVKTDNCKHPLGFENHGIDNSQITVTSQLPHQHGKYVAHSGRLHNKYSWSSRTTDDPSIKSQEYIEVDLGQMKTVTGIATQGDPSEQMWVTSYNLEFKKYGGDWYEYTPSTDTESFEGNIDHKGLVLHWFDVRHHARYIRLLPKTWNKAIALRMELYGCEGLQYGKCLPSLPGQRFTGGNWKQVSCNNQPIGIKDRNIISDATMTSSSRRSNTTHAHHGRLQYTSHQSWCASMNDKNPYLQIDFGLMHVVCAVATQGNGKADDRVEVYTLKTSVDGKNWKNYEEDKNIKKFIVWNYERNSVSKHVLNSSPLARFVRFVPVKFHGVPCMRVEVYGTSHDACSKTIIGASATGRIPGYRFTASSSYPTYRPSYGRLHGPSCWAAETNHHNDYLQIDLGDPHTVCGVATQGCGKNSERVLTYNLAFSMDGYSWDFYQKSGRNRKIFQASEVDEVSIKRHTFTDIRTAKFVRFFPLKYYNHKSMRVEIYGLRQAWRGSLGVEADHGRTMIPDNHLTASSTSDPDHVESEGRLYGSSAWCTQGSHNPYFEVDLGKPKEVVAIATQGDPGNPNNYVKRYHLHYGFTSDRWMKVKDVQGNSDGVTVRVFWLQPTVGARYIRIVPTDWNGVICLRIDVYGNKQVPPPKLTSSKIKGNVLVAGLPSSHVTIHCLATADSNLHFKWFSSTGDVTNKSSGNVYDRGQVISKLQVNYTSASDVLSHYHCVSVNQSTSRCRMTFTCQALYGDIMGERKDHDIDIQITKDVSIPTTSVVKTTTQLPSKSVSRARTVEITDEAIKSSASQLLDKLLLRFMLILFHLVHMKG